MNRVKMRIIPPAHTKEKYRGTQGGGKCCKKNRWRIEDDVAERASYVLDKSLEEQAVMYELFEAKKKAQVQKVKVSKYFMKYGKYN